MSLFKTFKGTVRLHSGADSGFLIDYNRLTKGDLEALAFLGKRLAGPFGEVLGIPRGGLALAEAMRKHIDRSSDRVLVVDDVWTTGTCMRAALSEHPGALGLVIFARGPLWNDDVKAIFRLHAHLEAV